jgi:hypothetical protein
VHDYPEYSDVVDDILDAHNLGLFNQINEIQALEAIPTLQDYDILKPFFAWAPKNAVKRTLSVT